MGLDDGDLKELEHILLSNPQKGSVKVGLGGAGKLRIKLEGRGKSGGCRVIYLDMVEREKLYLLSAYPMPVYSPEYSENCMINHI